MLFNFRRFCGKFHVKFSASNQTLERPLVSDTPNKSKKIFQKHTKTQGEPFFDPIIFAFLILQNSVFLNTWWLRPASRTLPHSEPGLWTCRVWHRAQNNSRENSAVQLKKISQIPWKNTCKFHVKNTTKTRWNTSLLIWRTEALLPVSPSWPVTSPRHKERCQMIGTVGFWQLDRQTGKTSL